MSKAAGTIAEAEKANPSRDWDNQDTEDRARNRRLTDDKARDNTEWVLEYMRAHPYGERSEDGTDLSLLGAKLRLTPTERLEKLQRAVDFLKEMRRAGIEAGLPSPSRRPR